MELYVADGVGIGLVNRDEAWCQRVDGLAEAPRREFRLALPVLKVPVDILPSLKEGDSYRKG